MSVDHYRQLDRDTQVAIDRAVANAKIKTEFHRLRCGIGEVNVTPLGRGRFGWQVTSCDGFPIAEGIR